MRINEHDIASAFYFIKSACPSASFIKSKADYKRRDIDVALHALTNFLPLLGAAKGLLDLYGAEAIDTAKRVIADADPPPLTDMALAKMIVQATEVPTTTEGVHAVLQILKEHR